MQSDCQAPDTPVCQGQGRPRHLWDSSRVTRGRPEVRRQWLGSAWTPTPPEPLLISSLSLLTALTGSPPKPACPTCYRVWISAKSSREAGGREEELACPAAIMRN